VDMGPGAVFPVCLRDSYILSFLFFFSFFYSFFSFLLFFFSFRRSVHPTSLASWIEDIKCQKKISKTKHRRMLHVLTQLSTSSSMLGSAPKQLRSKAAIVQRIRAAFGAPLLSPPYCRDHFATSDFLSLTHRNEFITIDNIRCSQPCCALPRTVT